MNNTDRVTFIVLLMGAAVMFWVSTIAPSPSNWIFLASGCFFFLGAIVTTFSRRLDRRWRRRRETR